MLKSILLIIFMTALYSGCQDKSNKENEAAEEREAKEMEEMMPQEEAATVLSQEETPYFKGVGTEPFWDVQISDEMIRFFTLNKADEKLVAPHVAPVQVADANIKTYTSTLDDGTLKVTIAQAECSDNMSETMYNYQVVVEIKKDSAPQPITYEGCGNYVTDYRLNDIWVLEEMEGEAISPEAFSKTLPNIEIDTKENRFSGYAGCNRMTGSLFFENDLLRFTKVATTRMMCPSPNKEGDFLKALQASTTYKIADNRLYLSNPDGIKLVFKKVD